MQRERKSFFPLLTEKILSYISYILILSSIVIEILAKKSMGFQRDLIYRRGILESLILSSELIYIYKWIALAGVASCLGLIIFKGYKLSGKLRKYIWQTIAFSMIFFLMLTFYRSVSLIAYPLMVGCMGAVASFQYIRIINHKDG
tara:strand:- start:24 stop:458 length:435 start_codon:yes stop_codon:yes gene_type:complete